MERSCVQCGRGFEARRATAKYCSASCRANASKGIASIAPVKGVVAPVVSGLVDRLRGELEAAGVLETSEADAALELAGMVSDAGVTPAARVAAARELRAAKAEALASVKRQDSVDEVTRRRDEKLAAARGA